MNEMLHSAETLMQRRFAQAWYDFSCTVTCPFTERPFMKKTGVNQELLHVLVSLYNESIQTYYYFPEVIFCGRQRMERACFEALLASEYIIAYKADSFGKYFRLSKKGEQFLLTFSFRRRPKQTASLLSTLQRTFPFSDACLPSC